MVNIKSFPNNQDEYIGAEEVMRWHHGRSSGVFGADGNAAVAPILNTMAVEVSDGIGWLANENGYGVAWWIENEAKNGKKLQLSVDMADAVLPRIDRVVVSWQTTNYVALPQVRILKGTPASKPVAPALTNDSLVRMISLAAIRIPAGATFIDASMVTDERLDASVCGIVTDAVGVDTSVMQAQFASFWANNIADFEAYREQQNADMESYVADQKAELEALVANHQAELDAYIARQQTELDAHIARQQTELDAYIARQQTAWEAFIANSEEVGLVPVPAPADKGKAMMVNENGDGYTLADIEAVFTHLTDKNNPHKVTAAQIGAVPTTRKINNKELAEDITLSASDIGALNKNGDIMSSDLHFYGHMYINRNHGGLAKTVGNDLDPHVPKLRNSSLNAADTTPTEDGTICWTYK